MSIKKPQKAGKKKQKQRKGGGAAFSWPQCLEAHNLCAEQHVFPREGVTEADVAEFAMSGDIVAQAYLYSLRRAVPSAAETRRPLVPSYVETLLMAHVRRLNNLLCELATIGRWIPCEELWEQALNLTETFSKLALQNPAPFKAKAQQSLFMPSVRAKQRKFTADATAIADAIELSAKTVGDKITDNRTRIGALCARLVGECVHEIRRARDLWMNLFIPYGRPVVWPTRCEIEPFLGKTVDELIARIRSREDKDQMSIHIRSFCLLAGCGIERLHFLTLPELTVETAPKWWKGAIEKMVEARFPILLGQPGWEKELKAVSRGTKADMRKELKDYCVGKVKQFASH